MHNWVMEMTSPLYHNMTKTKSFYPIKCPHGFNDVRETTYEISPRNTDLQILLSTIFLFISSNDSTEVTFKLVLNITS